MAVEIQRSRPAGCGATADNLRRRYGKAKALAMADDEITKAVGVKNETYWKAVRECLSEMG